MKMKTTINHSSLKFFIMTNLISTFATFALITASFTFASAQKKQMVVVSTTTIEATPEEVYDVLRSYERFPDWSPFLVTDPEQKYHVTGIDGEVGSTFHWEGVGEKSKGNQTITELREQEYLRMNCDITVPFESKPCFEYALQDTENGVVLVQTFTVEASGFSGFMMKLFGVKKHIQATNELGLQRLKDLLEEDTAVSATP